MRGIDILEKRDWLGMSKKELADSLGYTTKEITDWENEICEIPANDYKRIMDFATNLPYSSNAKEPQFRFIDLFADIGGMRIPFQNLGGECVFATENDIYAKKTYDINFNEDIDEDITHIKSEDIPDLDILLASFTCRWKKDKEACVNEPALIETKRIIRDKRPKMFLLETGKEFTFKPYENALIYIIVSLMVLNYDVSYAIYSAVDFGLPQKRKRTYIVGIDKNYYKLPDKFKFDFPVPPKGKTKVGDILQKNVTERYTISDKLWNGLNRRKANGVGYEYCLLNAESPCTPAITPRYYRDGAEALIEQPGKKPRTLTPRECARLQGFPDDFIFPVSNQQAYIQIGKSVTLPVIQAIGEKMKEFMDNKEYTKG